MPKGTERSRLNATRHGILSRETILPWEDEAEYRNLLASLIDEHGPEGPTEHHIVEEITGVIWRKRRLRLAEGAAHDRALNANVPLFSQLESISGLPTGSDDRGETVLDAILTTEEQTEQDIREYDRDEKLVKRAIATLSSNRSGRYEAAVAVLPEEVADWWDEYEAKGLGEVVAGKEPFSESAVGLRRFLEDKVLPAVWKWREDAQCRSAVRRRAFGDSFDPESMDKLARYETHLDRKLERHLTMLFRLQQIRRDGIRDAVL